MSVKTRSQTTREVEIEQLQLEEYIADKELYEKLEEERIQRLIKEYQEEEEKANVNIVRGWCQIM